MGANEALATWVAIASSVLPADFARRGEEVRAVLDAGADVIHFDVVDNRCVPNLTIGPMVCSGIKPYGAVLIGVNPKAEPVNALVPCVAQVCAGVTRTYKPARCSTPRRRWTR